MKNKREKILGHDINKKPLLHVDATPNEGLVLRILEAYRHDATVRFVFTHKSPLLELMNEHQEQRLKLLDAAIAKLKAK